MTVFGREQLTVQRCLKKNRGGKVMTGETDIEIPDTGAVFTFGKSKIANNVPSRLWLKNDIPVHISCGQSHSAFVTEEGRLFVFGNNNRGQLGLKTKGAVTKPICVKVLNAEKVRFVACGTDHTLVSTSQWEVFAVGGNSDGQLGLGHCHNSVTFQRLHPFCDYAPIKLLCAGGRTSAALTEDGRLFLWGDNSVGQLGLGNESPVLLPKELKVGQPIQWVSCGYRHSALVTDNGDVFTFGESAEGRLGLSANQLANHIHPQRVDSLCRVLQVACGGKHTLALTEDELYSFGRGEYGQLGLGTLVFVADLPVAVGHFRKGRVTHVMCGEHHSALITDSGLLYTFGDGRHGKLGLGDENFTNQFRPTVCQRFFDYSVMSVACGSSHTLVFARPRQKESKEVCLEDEDVTYSFLDRCYNSMLQGQPLEHIPDPILAIGSQPTFLSASLPTSHRWSLSTRSRRRQRESSSAQFGPKFKALPPIASNFTSLALTCNILLPRSPAGTPKRLKTEVPVETLSTSVTMPVTPVTNNGEVGVAENSMSDKKHEQNEDEMPRSSSIERVELRTETVPQQALPTKLLSGYVSHPSMSVSSPTSNLKRKKAKSRHSLAEECSYVLASQSKTCKKTIQSENKEVKSQPVEVKYSSDRMSGEVIQEAKSSPVKIQHTSSQFDPDEVRTSPTKVTEKQQNSTPVKITSQTQNIPKNGKNDVDTEKTPLTPTPKTSNKRRSDVKREGNVEEQSPVQKNITGIIETPMKTPRPPSLFIPTEREGQPWRERAYGMSKVRTRKPTEVEKVQFRPEKLEQETTGIKKRQTSNKTLKNSDIFFPPIESRQSAGKGPLEKSQSLSNLQSDHTKNHSEQKQEFPFIRDHLSSGQWSNNQSESKKLVKTEPVLGTDTLNSDRTSQAEQSIVGTTVLSLPTLANAAAIPLLIKAAEVFSETLHINQAPQQNPEISLCSSTLVLGDTKGNNIVPEEEEDQNSVLQVMSAIDKDQETDDSSTEQHEDVNDKPFSDKKENWKSGNGEREDGEDGMERGEDGMEREEDGGAEEYLAEEHHNEGVVKDKENSPSKYKEEEEGESKDDEDSGDQENTDDTEKECEKDERENKESKSAEEEKEDSNAGQSSEDEEEKSKGERSENEHEREENENKNGEDVEKEEKERQESGDEETKEENERVTENETFREEDKGEEIDEEEEEDSKSDEDKAEECGDDEEEKEEEERDEKESWNEEGEKEAEKETNENTDVEEEDESSNDWLREEAEKTEGAQESECKAEDKSQGSDEQEEKKESKEIEEEEEENETGEEDENTSEGESDRDENAGEEEEQEESEEEDMVGNENEQESQEEEHDNEEEEEKIQEKGKEEEENEEEESEEEEDDEEEEEGDNEDSEEQKDTDDKGINNREEDKEDGEEEEDSEREEKIKTNKKIYDKRKDKKQRKIKGNKNYEASSEEEEADQREEVVRNDQRKEEGKEKIDTSEEFKEEETMEISETQESEEHEEEIESEEEAKNEEEEETTQKEKYLRKQKATNSDKEKQEEESGEDEEEEVEEEEEAEEEEEDVEEEEGEAEEEEEEAEEDEEEAEEEEEEAEEEAEEEEDKTEEEDEKTEEEEEDYDEEEEEEGKDKRGRTLKQRVRATSLPMSKQSIKQTNAERDRPKTGIKNKKNLKEKKQISSNAQDLQFWNNVLPQYLNLK